MHTREHLYSKTSIGNYDALGLPVWTRAVGSICKLYVWWIYGELQKKSLKVV